MTEKEFMKEQQAAIERMRAMSSKADINNSNRAMPPIPPFVRLQGSNTSQNNKNQQMHKYASSKEAVPEKPLENKINPTEKNNSGGFSGLFGLPFSDIFGKESDAALIIGLLLILMSEKADKKLLFALVYILM